MNDNALGLEKAIHPDGFVDFYAILGVDSSTPASQIQESINALYQEAQMNRDHRVAARRREYQTLLEVLPQARLVLLDEARSKRYRAYCHAVEMELPRMPYPEFLSTLVREKEVADVRTDILTIRDLSRLRIASGEEAEVPKPAAPTIPQEAPTLAEPVAPPVVEEARLETVAPLAAPVAPAAGPVSEAQKFSLSSLLGGGLILLGLLASLPTLAGVPLILAVALALLGAGVCAYVFSLTGEVIEA